jgi:hypothetical protein
MVNQSDSVLQLIYTPGVNLTTNLTITINFTDNLNSSTFINMTIDNTAIKVNISNKTNGTNLISNLTILSAITANKTVIINFGFTTPPKMSSYNAITGIFVASTNGIKYEELNTTLTFQVGKALPATFHITSLNPKAGAYSGYKINFFTAVSHPDPFFLKVTLP